MCEMIELEKKMEFFKESINFLSRTLGSFKYEIHEIVKKK